MIPHPPFQYQPVRQQVTPDGDDEATLRGHAGRANLDITARMIEDDGLGPSFILNDEGRRISLSRDERIQRFNKSLFARVFYEDRLRSENETKELLPYRVRVAYRITKELAKQKNICHHEEPLSEALTPREIRENQDGPVAVWNPDPWTIGNHFDPDQAKNSKVRAPTQYKELVPIFLQSEEASHALHGNKTEVGFGLMPPPAPQPETNGHKYDPNDPTTDPLLHLWLDAVDIIVLKLGISNGTANDPDHGTLGLLGMLDPQTVRQVWPTRTQIMMWEGILTEETLDLMLKGTAQTTRKELEHKYGFNQREQNGLIRQANVLARQLTTGDREDARAIMVLRLEEYCRRSREALDLRAELNGMKQLSIITGLSDAANNDPMTDFLDAVKQVSRDKKIASGMNALKALAERGPSRAVSTLDMIDTTAKIE
jgi:hypothetical protein